MDFGDKFASYIESWTHLLSVFAPSNPHSSDFGDICALYSPFLHQLAMQSFFLNLEVYGLVQATVGVGTVLIWDFCLAYTRGEGCKCNAATEDMDLVKNLPVTLRHAHICCECLPT